jgi:hypothetical protein
VIRVFQLFMKQSMNAPHRPITTKSTQSQAWFDRGLIWTYAFNHEESANCFKRAIEIDPGCAMAYWCLAYSIGPNYKPWSHFDAKDLHSVVSRGHTAARLAAVRLRGTSAVELALITLTPNAHGIPKSWHGSRERSHFPSTQLPWEKARPMNRGEKYSNRFSLTYSKLNSHYSSRRSRYT